MPTQQRARKDKRVTALSWPHFLDHMREHWEVGQHMALIGPTGEGKSTLALGLLELRRWVVVLDPKGEDDTLNASGYTRLKAWPPPGRIRDQIADGYPARLLIGGPNRTDAEAARLSQLMQDAVEGVRGEGRWTLYVDEFQLLADRRMMGVTTQVEQLLIAARTRGTSVMTAFQAPAWVPRAATRQATYVIMWGTHDEDSVKTIAQAMGRPWRELQAMAQQLPEYHVLVIPKKFREPMILTHPPRVG